MLDEQGKRLWARVCASVTRFGQPRPSSSIRQPLIDHSPKSTLDLHGMTIHVAFAVAKAFINDTPHRDVLVITGQGQISYEFPDWLQQWPRVQTWSRQNDGGAYRVRMRQ